MSSIKRKFSNVAKKYNRSLNDKKKILERLEKQNSTIMQQQNEYICFGLLYYTKERRKNLLLRAEKLCYSKKIIDNLNQFSDENWNSDSVNEQIIKDFETMESYVNEHTPSYEKSVMFALGKTFFQNDIEEVEYKNE